MIINNPATPEKWDDIRTVFGTRGDSSWCFCQYFTDTEWNRGKETNQNSLRQQIDTLDPPPGLLAYREGEPVGWIQTGTSSRYARFNPKGHLAEDDIWVITCFVVRAEYRGTGIATALLHEAVKHARKHGTNTLPVRPTDTTLIKKSSAALFTGILSTFDAAGFNHVNQNRSRVILELNPNQHSQTSTTLDATGSAPKHHVLHAKRAGTVPQEVRLTGSGCGLLAAIRNMPDWYGISAGTVEQ